MSIYADYFYLFSTFLTNYTECIKSSHLQQGGNFKHATKLRHDY